MKNGSGFIMNEKKNTVKGEVGGYLLVFRPVIKYLGVIIDAMAAYTMQDV